MFSKPFVVAGPKPAFGGPRTAAFLGSGAGRTPRLRRTVRLIGGAVDDLHTLKPDADQDHSSQLRCEPD